MKYKSTCFPRWIALLTVLVCCVVSYAAVVKEVEFRQSGGTRLANDQLTLLVRLRKGVEFTRDYLDEDIKKLYATGNFSDVSGDTEMLSRNEVKVIFFLRTRDRIRRIEFKGNVKFKTHELAKVLTIREGVVLNQVKLRESTVALRKFYFDRGYREATIFPTMIPDKDGYQILTFQIDEKLRIKVDKVVFEGNKVFSQWNLRHSIANRFSYLNYIPFLNDYLNQGLLDRRELNLDKARLRDKYHDAGYLDFKVKDVVYTPRKDDPEYVSLKFVVDEGKPYTISKITITGNLAAKTDFVKPLISLKPNQVFSKAKQDESVRKIIGLYETMGYADVTCRAIQKADAAKHTVDVTFALAEGRKYYVRDVIIVGNTETKDKVIRRELVIQPGDPVDKNRIEISKQRLLGMGYFEKVEASHVNADASDEKDVKFHITEKKSRYNLRVGAGASDVNNIFGMAEISTDNFDITNPKNWFYGGGQRVRVQGVFGVDTAGFNVDFVEPWLFDLPIRFELSGYMNEVCYDDWNEWRTGGRTSFQRKIFDDFTSINLGYKFEVVRVHDASKWIEDASELGIGETELVSQPSLTLMRDTRDNMIDPTEGYLLSLFGAITPRALGSSRDYYKVEAKGSYHFNFWDKAVVFSIGAKGGTMSDFNKNKPVPVYERYFLGGSSSLRGFDYRSVSPNYSVDGKSKTVDIGGQTMLLFTTEISHPIWGPLRGAIFMDAGGVWGDAWEVDFSDFNIGAGYGLRLKLPWLNVPIRVDLAFPVLNNTDNSNKLRVHFNVGFTF